MNGAGTALEHFDSVHDVSDYLSQAHVWFLNGTWRATDKLSLYGEGVLALTEASFTPFNQPEAAWSATDPSAPRNWDNDYSRIQAYSDLEYTQLEATLGGSYKVAPDWSVYGSVTLMDLQDDQPYVYGDRDGRLVLWSTGMTVGF